MAYIGRNISVENKDKEIAANSHCVVTLIRLKLYLLQASTPLGRTLKVDKKGWGQSGGKNGVFTFTLGQFCFLKKGGFTSKKVWYKLPFFSF